MEKSEGTTVVVQVHARAAENAVIGFRDNVLHIRIKAPPVEGKANRELVAFLSERLGVSQSRISIERGAAGKRKWITIQGLERARIESLLAR